MARTQQRRHLAPLLISILLLLAFLIHTPTGLANSSFSKQKQVVETGNITNLTPPEGARHIKFGIQILDIDNLSVNDMTFLATGWYWLKWDQSIQDLLERDHLKIEDVVKPLNLIEPWFSKFEPSKEGVKRQNENEYYQLFNFSGTFFFNELDQDRAPFIKVWAPIDFEIEPSNYAIGKPDQIFLVPDDDSNSQVLGSYGDISGFQNQSASIGSYTHEYPNNFGLGDRPSSYAGIQLDMTYSVAFWTGFVEFLLPMLLVFLLLISSPFSDPRETDFRLSTPATAILTFIFLQSFTNDRFPPTPELSYMDQLFAYCYIAAIAIFGLFMWSSSKLNQSPDDDKTESIKKIRKVERIVQVSCIAGMALVAIAEWTA